MRVQVAAVMAAYLALAGPVCALECLVPSVERDYWWYQKQPETYVLAHGGFTDLKKADRARVGPINVAPALAYEVWTGRFVGFLASRRAFDKPFETEVTLIFPDYSVIGGGSDTSVEVEYIAERTGLVWLMKTEGGYQARASICSGVVDTDAEHVKPALRCLRNGYCPKSG